MRRGSARASRAGRTPEPEYQRHHADAGALCRYLRDDLGVTRLALSFSMGKDALCAWWQLREHGIACELFYLYPMPGLRFIEESLAYYEDALHTRVRRYPNPSFLRMLRGNVYQPPERWPIIRDLEIPKLSHEDIEDDVRAATGVDWIATGVRAVDSPARVAAVRKTGALNPKRRTVMPVFDWRLARVRQCLDALKAEGIGLPVDYEMFGRTFDGIDARFTGPLRERFPDDYARLLEWFPLADVDLFRREVMR